MKDDAILECLFSIELISGRFLLMSLSNAVVD